MQLASISMSLERRASHESQAKERYERGKSRCFSSLFIFQDGKLTSTALR